MLCLVLLLRPAQTRLKTISHMHARTPQMRIMFYLALGSGVLALPFVNEFTTEICAHFINPGTTEKVTWDADCLKYGGNGTLSLCARHSKYPIASVCRLHSAHRARLAGLHWCPPLFVQRPSLFCALPF